MKVFCNNDSILRVIKNKNIVAHTLNPYIPFLDKYWRLPGKMELEKGTTCAPFFVEVYGVDMKTAVKM